MIWQKRLHVEVVLWPRMCVEVAYLMCALLLAQFAVVVFESLVSPSADKHSYYHIVKIYGGEVVILCE
jgi:hypothetical protein